MKRFFILIAAILCSAVAFGQQQLPNDTLVRKGMLDNGMTYYIRHNDKPAGRAEFYLATNVGAIQETPDQDGLAHFLEHMCFNGTKNFPDKGILQYLQSIGAEFGRNINAMTGVEETVYMLNNIPVTRKGIVDTCLLILHDYSHFVTCDPVEIDKERGVIIEEKRARNSASWRMHEKSLPYYYGDSKYAGCTLIGSQENLETFKPESLTNFYHTWYRPDMQAVIVVGDVDVDEIEAQLKTTFSDIPAAENPKAKDIHMIPDNEKPIVGIITDPEATSTHFEILWKGVPAPEEYNSTDFGFMSDLVEDIIYLVMSERFNDIVSKPDAPFMSAFLGITDLCETCEVIIGDVAAKEGSALQAYKTFMTEVEKMKRHGFTDAEVERAKANLLSSYEKNMEGAQTRKNEDFIDEYLSNFFDNEPYMDPAVEYELAKNMCGMLNAQFINTQVLPTLIPQNNLVVVYKAPEKEGIVHPTEAEILAATEEIRNAEIAANEAEEGQKELLDAASLKGSPVKKTATTVYGATEWRFKNGAKVVVLPTDYQKDQVTMRLEKNGGLSLIATEDLPSFEMNIRYLFEQNTGVAGFTGNDLAKVLAGKNVSVTFDIDEIRHGFDISSTPKDIETALQLLYLRIVSPRFDENEFDTAMQQIKNVYPNLILQPNFIFSERLTDAIYGDDSRKEPKLPTVIEKASLVTFERVYRELFKDAAGTTLYIVGNVNLDELKPLVEKYIGSLPKGKKATQWREEFAPRIVEGTVEDHFEAAMQMPMNTVFQGYVAYQPYSIENTANLDAAKFILDMIYTETLREEESGTYGAGTMFGTQKFPVERSLIQVFFNTNPASVEKLSALAVDGVKKLANEGPTEQQVSMAVENLKKNIPENRINNGYWMKNLKYFYNYGIADYDAAYEAAVSNISVQSIKDAVSSILETGNFIEVVMSPKGE